MNLSNSRVRFITLGCKVNQYETQGMREVLERAGAKAVSSKKPASDEVDFVVINTCTVTAEADKENKYWIRRAKRDHPQARIIVTGCGVVRDRASIEALPEVDLVLAQHEKDNIADRLLEACGNPSLQDAPVFSRSRQEYTPLSISESEGHTRAFVKIQDGCNHACSFCKVVLVRGRSRSRELADILDEIKRLRDSGYSEIVFAGIQLGAYGLDFKDENIRLIEVLEAASQIEGIERLRLSSIEPTDVSPELIRALGEISKCCHHLHIPLQSGDDEILKGMNRRYRRAFYIDLIARLKDQMPDFSLTLDVMAGFPGETEDYFQNTIALLEAVKPLKCHVFPYSRREGTMAARLEDVPDEILQERVLRLKAVGERLGRAELAPYIGKTLPILVERSKKNAVLRQGLSTNYLKVYFQGSQDWLGKIVPVELMAIQGDAFLGKSVLPRRS